MTDVDDYMAMLRESQLKRTIVIEDVDKIILENKQLKEELKEICEKYLKIETTVSAYEDAYKDLHAYIKKLKELLKEIRGKIHYINTPKNRHNIFDKYFVDKIDEVL